MSLPTLEAIHNGELVRLRDIELDEVAALRRMFALPGLREWWGAQDPDDDSEILNDGCAFAIEIDGVLAGWLGFDEELDPQYKFASLDIMLAPGYHGRGLGPAALRLAIGWLIDERGHRRFTIDPAADNARAIAAYVDIGFRPVGLLREYELTPDGTYRDGLLMDLLASEIRPPSGL